MPPAQSDLYNAFDTPPDAIVAFLVWVADQAGLRRPTVADIGAGPGRLLAPLATRGWAVTAYEPDPEYRAAARAIASPLTPEVVVRDGGFEAIEEVEAFDLVLGINSSFAHLLTDSQRATGLGHALAALRPGGLLVLDLPNFPWILDHYRVPIPQERPFQGGHLQLRRQHTIDRDRALFTTVDQYVLTGTTPEPLAASKTHTYAIVSQEHYTTQLREAGFKGVGLFSSFESRVPQVTIQGPRLIYVAHRPAAG